VSNYYQNMLDNIRKIIYSLLEYIIEFPNILYGLRVTFLYVVNVAGVTIFFALKMTIKSIVKKMVYGQKYNK
jgi:hypothetical protein